MAPESVKSITSRLNFNLITIICSIATLGIVIVTKIVTLTEVLTTMNDKIEYQANEITALKASEAKQDANIIMLQTRLTHGK